jgi:hypothetical protein
MGIYVSEKLKAAVGLILRPLSKLLIQGEISCAHATEMLKTSLVQVASEKLIELNEPITDTRIHLMTGVHRKDVKRIKGAQGSDQTKQSNMPLTSQALSKWIGDPQFLNADGSPRPLEKKTNGSQDSFDDLIYSLSKDVRSKAVLDEMISRKMVAIDRSGLIALNLENIIANQPTDEVTHFLGMNIHDHLEVAVGNLTNPHALQLERSAHYFGLSESAAKELEEFSKKEGMRILMAINEKAQALIKDPSNHGAWSTNFGVYAYKKEKVMKKDSK